MPPKHPRDVGTMTSNKAHQEELIRYIKNVIHDNNHLALSGEQLESMANTLVGCSSKHEVYEWCQTLMIGEVLAAEVIKRRTDHGPRFDDDLPQPKVSAEATGGRVQNPWSNRGGKKKGVSAAKGNSGDPAATSSLRPCFSECGCFATEHKLRGNCANCGRIICERESDETCYSCGLDPSTCVAYEIKVQEGRLSEAALLEDRGKYEAAIARRDELLKFAETRAKRTKVIDDQKSVFFAPKSAWMTVLEREKAAKDEALAERQREVAAMHRRTGAYTVHLDIMNQNVSLGCPAAPTDRQCLRSSSSSSSASQCPESGDSGCGVGDVGEVRALPLPSLMQKVWYSLDGSTEDPSFAAASVATNAACDGVQGKKPIIRAIHQVSRRVQQDYYEDDARFYRDVYRDQLKQCERDQTDCAKNIDDAMVMEKDVEREPAKEEPPAAEEEVSEAALQGVVLAPLTPTPAMLMNDAGVCLSMHQPWAGLLVAGIKVHEGRIWSTGYRGRLWVHAASSQPHDIKEIEKRYAKFMTPNQQFPKHYPTRVLLGYVYLMDCLDREAYEKSYTPEQRQEESPFSLICAPGRELPFPLPMSGDHKLFNLCHKLHTAARKQLNELS